MRRRAGPFTLTLTLALALVAGPQLGGGQATATTGELVGLLDALARSFPGGAGLYVADPTATVPIYARNADEPVISASLFKLGLLVEAERLVDAGAMTYGTAITIQPEDVTDEGSYVFVGAEVTLDEALELMITVSDNGSALALWRILGPANVNATLAKAGLSAFHVAVDNSEENVATPRAFGQFFALLARRQLVSAAASERMLARLGRQKINDRLPAKLPPNALVAHKTGNLVGLVHDAGIIYTSSGPRIVVAMTWDVGDDEAAQFIGAVGSLVYAATVEPPASAGYQVPSGATYLEVGTTRAVSVLVSNLGPRAWTATGDGAVSLYWELRDERDAPVGWSTAPLALGSVAVNGTLDVPLAITAPGAPGDYRVTVGLANAYGVPLASGGTGGATFVVRAHEPFVVKAELGFPAVLHREEASLLAVMVTALPDRSSAAHQFSLAWRISDPETRRGLASGSMLLGTLPPGVSSGAWFAPLFAPPLRGTYRFEYELRERGLIASETASVDLEILAPRSYAGERGSFAKVGPLIRGPAAVTASPQPTARGRTPSLSPGR